MDNFMHCVLFILIGCHHISNALQLTSIEVPQVVDFRDRITLSCSYNMGTHKLNSVKWYKDGLEFFRYSPMMQEIFMTFAVEGVVTTRNKYACNEYTCSVELIELRPKSSGAYRCEVSGDAPEFKLISQTANMTVAALPQSDPIIYGVLPSYNIDDCVVANCTSDWSTPPATLSWYINDEKAPLELLQPQHETTILTNGFIRRIRSLEIRFCIDHHRFRSTRGILKMKCIADISQFPDLIRDKTVKAIILSKDDLTNQKLVNWKSSADRKFPSSIALLLDAGVFLITMRFLRINHLKDIVR